MTEVSLALDSVFDSQGSFTSTNSEKFPALKKNKGNIVTENWYTVNGKVHQSDICVHQLLRKFI